MDLAVLLDPNCSLPKFVQLSQALKDRILTGALEAGSLVPPTRELSHSLGLSRGTVVKAYDELIAQGYLEAITGSGTYVTRQTKPEPMQHDQTAQIDEHSASLSEEAKSLMSLDFSRGMSGFAPALNYGAPPVDLLPCTQWKEILVRQARLQRQHHDCSPDNLGHSRLRKEIALYLGRSRGIECHPDQVVIFASAQQALTNIARVLVNENDVVVLENPGYGGARDNFSMRQAKIMTVEIDRDGVKVDDLKAIDGPVKLAYVSPSHHDPTGVIMSLERRQALLNWASKKKALIVEDGWDSDYVYGHAPLPSLQGMDKENRVLYVYTFWKSLFPLSTASCLVVPPYLVPVFDRVKLMTERSFPMLEHCALAEFLAEGKFERHVMQTRKIYERRRKVLIESLFRYFKTEIVIEKQSAGLHLCVQFAQRYTGDQLEKAAQNADLAIVSTADYYIDGAPANEFLVSFAPFTEEELAAKTDSFASNLWK